MSDIKIHFASIFRTKSIKTTNPNKVIIRNQHNKNFSKINLYNTCYTLTKYLKELLSINIFDVNSNIVH